MSAQAKFRFLLYATMATAIASFLFLRPSTPALPSPVPEYSETIPDADLDAAVAEMKNAFANAPALDPALDPGVWCDLNDDGLVDASDAVLNREGVAEWVRANDDVPNGRNIFADRLDSSGAVRLEDDIQPVYIKFERDAIGAADVNIETSIEPIGAARLVDDATMTEKFGLTPTPWGMVGYLAVESAKPGDEFSLRVHVKVPGGSDTTSEQKFKVAGRLGSPEYFASVRDYLSEPLYPGGPLPKVFMDEIDCPNGEDGEFERFILTAMPHEDTRVDVIETFYSKPAFGDRDASIAEVAANNPGYTFIVNGNYFHDAKDNSQHGSSCLGAVVSNGEATDAGGRHRWFEAHREAMLPKQLDWNFKAYSLVQPGEAPGEIALVEEPVSDDRPFYYTTEDGTLPHAQLGGLHTVHTFINNVGGNKSHFWLANVEHADGKTSQLICSAMTHPHESTSKTGGPAFRNLLRGSGLTIEEFNPKKRNVPPGHSDVVYLDGGTSVCIAIDLGHGYEIPLYSARHAPEGAWTRCNNYLAFTVDR